MNNQHVSRISSSALSVASVASLYVLGLAGLAAASFMRYGAQMVHSIRLGFFPLPWLYEMWADFYPTAMLLSAFFIAITAVVWVEARLSSWAHHRIHAAQLAYQTRPVSRGYAGHHRRLVHR